MSVNPKALIQMGSVSYQIDKKIILNTVDFSILPNEIITIVGPNGAGKSTLLNLALGLKKPSQGHIHRQPNLTIGYVPQSINRDYTIPVNVKDFLKLCRKRIDPNKAKAIFSELDIDKLASTLLFNLSGGELRRVLLARALLSKPDILVLDEPTAGVDIAGQESFYKRLNEWREREHFAILMVSHDLHLVMSATDHVICLNKHICCQGKPAYVIQSPHYLSLFGNNNKKANAPLAFYAHQHDHKHEA